MHDNEVMGEQYVVENGISKNNYNNFASMKCLTLLLDNMTLTKFFRLFYSSCILSGIFFLGYLSVCQKSRGNWHIKYFYSSIYDMFTVGATCNIPQLDPWDPSIKKYLTTFNPLKCKTLQHELTYLDNDGWLIVNETARIESGYSSLKCKYRCFEKNEGVDDVSLLYESWTNIDGNRTKIECEFIEVTCSGSFSPISVYSNLHSQIIINRTKLNEIEDDKLVNDKPSVLMFVLDSISKSNFHRYLPKFSNVLRDEFDSIVFEGFTKVGDNSFPNAAAVLTGKRVCVAGYANELPEDMSQSYFDDWPLIWYNFRNSGYMTYYAEDYPNFNLFQYTSNGFKYKPADHYFRPFWVQLWGSFLHRRSTNLCYGNNPKHLLQLKYLEQFWTRYQSDVPKFAFNWLTELGHDWLSQIALGDNDFQDFFVNLKEKLNNTIIIVFSDHGHRFDAIRESVIGRLEERMPYCSISLPSWMKRKYPQVYCNLKTNAKRLTSPYDLHATLIDILRNDFEDVTQNLKLPTRGLSLFRPIPATRHCSDAGIPEEFCICQEETSVNITDEKVVAAANALIEHVNYLLENFTQICLKLNVDNVRNAQTILPNPTTVFDEKSPRFYRSNMVKGFYINYRIVVDAAPSGAVFESMLRYSFADDKFSVIGDVNRINKYGNQSLCVQSALLKKFCYCGTNLE